MSREMSVSEKRGRSESGRLYVSSFTDNEQAIQRYLDDELCGATSQAVQQMIASSPALAESYQELQSIDQHLFTHFTHSTHTDDDVQHHCIERIMNALPQQTPVRERNVSIAEMCFAAVIMAGIISSYAFAGSSSALASVLPVSALTICSIVVGMLMIFLARPLRRIEASIIRRLLNRRVHTATADALLYRCAGIAIVLGGTYIMWANA